ncbi:MAG: HDOD domain-containing protein [Motiliproteus sp.]
METTNKMEKAAVKVLLLDTNGTFFDWGERINHTGRNWHVLRVSSNGEMLSYLKENRFQAIVVVSSGRIQADNDCFIKAMTLQPQAVRILLPGMPLSNTQLSYALDLVHRVYPDPDKIETIATEVEYLIKINGLVHKQKTRDYVLSLGQLPSPPMIYHKLSEALSSERSNSDHISGIIEQDPALAAKVLKIINSAYFGLGRQISSIHETVTLLGIRTLRGLSISGHLVSLYPPHRNWSYFSFERMNQRALLVARLAQQICKDLKTNQAVQDQSFVGGLLHDLGVLVLASQDPQSYRKIMVASAQKNTPLFLVEKRMLGVFHGEVGAFLLAQWKLPAPIVEAVLLHHTPQLSAGDSFSPLAAVHIADALITDTETEIGANLGNSLCEEYVQRLRLQTYMPQWQVAAKKLERAPASAQQQ